MGTDDTLYIVFSNLKCPFATGARAAQKKREKLYWATGTATM